MRVRFASAALLALALLTCAPAFAAANFAGVWKLLPTNAPDESPKEAVLSLKQEGEKITGTVTADGKELTIQEATIQGNDLKFTVVAERDGVKEEVTIKVTLNGDTLKGSAQVEERTLEFTGARTPSAAPAAALAGAWSLTIETPNRTYKPTVTLAQDGEKLTGSMRTEEGVDAKLVSGSAKGDAIAFAIDLDVNGQTMHLEFSGKRTESGLKGEMRVDDQNFPWTGTRAVTATAPAK